MDKGVKDMVLEELTKLKTQIVLHTAQKAALLAMQIMDKDASIEKKIQQTEMQVKYNEKYAEALEKALKE